MALIQILGLAMLGFMLSPPLLAAPVIAVEEIRSPSSPEKSEDFVKVAVLQWNAGVTPLGVSAAEGQNILQRNREALARQIRLAAAEGARFIIAPEFAIPNYPDIPGIPNEENNFRNRLDIGPYVETSEGETRLYFGRLAQELGVYLHIGYAEHDPVTDHYHNSVMALDPRGEVLANHRKVSLFQMERQFLTEGAGATIYESPVGRVGLLICADVYCHALLEEYRRAQVDVLILSTSWAQPNTGMDHFRRAAQRLAVPLLAANQTYFPDSGVINADGTYQSYIRQSSGAAYGYLPRKGELLAAPKAKKCGSRLGALLLWGVERLLKL